MRKLSAVLSSVALASIFGAAAVTHAQSGTPVPTLKRQAPSEPPAMQPPPTTSEIKGSVKMPRVMIVEPKDGDKVPRKFTAKFAVEGMKVAKPTTTGDAPVGDGNFILIVDGTPVQKGQQVPKTENFHHLIEGQSEIQLELEKGEHTLTVQFADGNHSSYGDIMSQTITVKVK